MEPFRVSFGFASTTKVCVRRFILLTESSPSFRRSFSQLILDLAGRENRGQRAGQKQDEGNRSFSILPPCARICYYIPSSCIGKLLQATMSSEGEPESKKLRSSEPDLKVIIGSEEAEKAAPGADADGKASANGDGAEKKQPFVVTKWYHSPSLAAKSKYVDALLAAPMKESESRTITFPDISPETWELMMKFIDDPVASRSMKSKDVVKVAKFYDKYEFTGGSSLCDIVLRDYFKSVSQACPLDKSFSIPPLHKSNNVVPPDLDFVTKAVELAHEANLKDAFEEGMGFIWRMLGSFRVPIGRTMFSKNHMETLAPLLDATKGGVGSGRSCLNDYDLKNADFPKEHVEDSAAFVTRVALFSFISCIELSGSTCDADGRFVKGNSHFEFVPDDERKVRWKGEYQKVSIQCRTAEEGWVVVIETLPPLDEDGDPDYDSIVETVAWRAPHSGNLPLPPSTGWASVDPLARGEIKIKYILKEEAQSAHFSRS